MSATRRLDEIVVGERHRHDLGDISGLAESIRDVGLLHPIVITPNGQLIVGVRRLEAAKRLGWTEIPVTAIDIDSVVRGEYAENVHRKAFTPSELVAIGQELERIERTRGKARMVAAHASPGNLPEQDKGDTRDKIAAQLGVSGRTYEKARAVCQAADQNPQCASIKDQMDATGNVDRAFKQILAHQEEHSKPESEAKPNGARALMASRQETADGLDYFPTPPWATRALIEHVLPDGVGIEWRDLKALTVWEPACGEGHMAEPLVEYFGHVIATDVYNYGYGEAPVDFLDDTVRNADWIITNPPFDDKAIQFVLRARKLTRIGVAMFVRLQWLESIDRYERIFCDFPPTLVSIFVERVNLCKGRWDPEGTTATAYCWLVWVRGEKPRPPFWIPPGCRERLTHPDDVARFTTHPVTRKAHRGHRSSGEPPPERTPLPTEDGLNIPEAS